jgi:hypothetical protein
MEAILKIIQNKYFFDLMYYNQCLSIFSKMKYKIWGKAEDKNPVPPLPFENSKHEFSKVIKFGKIEVQSFSFSHLKEF